MRAHIPYKNPNAANAILPPQKDVSASIKMVPINLTTIEMIETIAGIGLDVIGAASIEPRLWFKIPHPSNREAIMRIMIPSVILGFLSHEEKDTSIP